MKRSRTKNIRRSPQRYQSQFSVGRLPRLLLRCISDFLTSLRGKRNRESTHSTAPARARWFTARRRNAVRHPPSLPPQLHVGLHRVRRWRTVRARPPDPRPSRGRQRPRFLQRFRVDYPSGSPRAGRARATTRRAIGVARRASARPVSPAARSRRRRARPFAPPRGVRRTANPHELERFSSRPEPVAAVRADSAANKRL